MSAVTAQPWYLADIDHGPGVQGDEAVVRGTRTPVRSVVSLYADVLDHDLRRVRQELPHLSERAIRAALAYYEAHRDEVDAIRRTHDDAYAALAAVPWRG